MKGEKSTELRLSANTNRLSPEREISMNRQHTNTRLGLALSTIGLALLTACGGGGEDTSVSDSLVTPAAVSTVCGMAPTVASVEEGYEQSLLEENVALVINGYNALISRLSSATGYPYDISQLPLLKLPMEDLREFTTLGYTAQPTDNQMGVELASSRLDAGSVGCVAGISRVQSATDGNNQPITLVSFTGSELSTLPLSSLEGAVVNGFEFIHNFTGTNATAMFRMNMSELTDAGAARICRINDASSVTCTVPTVGNNGTQWTLRTPISAPGIYMLTAPQESVL